MHLDRNLQLSILEELRAKFPDKATVKRLDCFIDSQEFHGNLIYLQGHGLVDGKIQHSAQLEGPRSFMLKAVITVAGLDFLESDGGLNAILGKVVIKFDDHLIEKLTRGN